MSELSDLILMAGPCSVESEDQIRRIAESVKEAGARYLRGGAFKPRTQGGDWEGHGEAALKWMRKAADEFELLVVTEILDHAHIQMFRDNKVDVYQVGARNAANQVLLNALGKAGVKVLLKNAIGSSPEAFLGSATRIPQEKLILCVRGNGSEVTYKGKPVARFDQGMGFLDYILKNANVPVIFDPSHISGRREAVYDLSMGAIAMGAHGLIVEAHYDPNASWTDARQTITLSQLKTVFDAAKLAREEYLSREGLRKIFLSATVPNHIDVYVMENEVEKVGRLLEGYTPKPYLTPFPSTGVLTCRLPDGRLGQYSKKGYSIGEIVLYKPEIGAESAKAIHIKTPEGLMIKMSPHNREAVEFFLKSSPLVVPEEGDTVSFSGSRKSDWDVRLELCHRYVGDVVRDGFATKIMAAAGQLDQSRISLNPNFSQKSVDTITALLQKFYEKPLVIYQVVD